MNATDAKIQEILAKRGLAVHESKEAIEAEVPEASARFQNLMDIYYLMKVTAGMEIPVLILARIFAEGNINWLKLTVFYLHTIAISLRTFRKDIFMHISQLQAGFLCTGQCLNLVKVKVWDPLKNNGIILLRI